MTSPAFTGDKIIGAMIKSRSEEAVRKLKGQEIKLYSIEAPALVNTIASGEIAASPAIAAAEDAAVHPGVEGLDAAAQDLRTPRVRDAPVLAVGVLEPLEHGREDLVLADGLDHVVDGLGRLASACEPWFW